SWLISKTRSGPKTRSSTPKSAGASRSRAGGRACGTMTTAPIPFFYSDAWRQIRGYRAAEWVDGATAAWHARIHPDDLQHVKDNIDRQADDDDDYEGLEYRERRKDGSYVWILSRGRAI